MKIYQFPTTQQNDTLLPDYGPIDVIRDDHKRQLELSSVLDKMAPELSAGEQPALVLSAIAFFKKELSRHIKDEEDSLFPLLAKHKQQNGQIQTALKQLRWEHEFDDDLVTFILSDLLILGKEHNLPNPTRLIINIRGFNERLQRHTAWEEAIVLPLAEQYLTDEEKSQLQREMAARRISASLI